MSNTDADRLHSHLECADTYLLKLSGRIEELEEQLAAVRKISDDGKLSWQQKHVAVWLAVHPEAAIGEKKDG